MQKQLLTIALVGIIIIAAVTAGGYYLGKLIQKPKTVSNESLFTPEPSATPTPSPASVKTPLLPTAPPRQNVSVKQQVKSATTTKSTTPITAVTGPSEVKPISVRFIELPSQVVSNKPFVISWFIDGPEGMMGTSTRLTSNIEGNNSISTSQAFGSFLLPQKFQSNVKFGSNAGTIVLKATAEINGKTYTAAKTLLLAE
jgi:hypothetical protein